MLQCSTLICIRVFRPMQVCLMYTSLEPRRGGGLFCPPSAPGFEAICTENCDVLAQSDILRSEICACVHTLLTQKARTESSWNNLRMCLSTGPVTQVATASGSLNRSGRNSVTVQELPGRSTRGKFEFRVYTRTLSVLI